MITLLRIEFNLQKNQYVYYYGTTEISYNDLNKKFKKYIDKENKKIAKNPELKEKINNIKSKGFFDITKMPLRKEFNPQIKQYVYYYGTEEISYNDLNKTTKKKLNQENKELINNPELLNKEIVTAKKKERFRYLASKGIICSSFKVISFEQGSMSKEIEKFLNELVAKENTILGIHRTGYATDEEIESILTNGLNLSGHLSSGAETSTVNINDNISFYPDNKETIEQLMYADGYKMSKGSILIEIPEEDLDKKLYQKNKEGETILNPKYIVGFIPIEEHHHISKIITAEDLKKSTSVDPDTDNDDFSWNPNVFQPDDSYEFEETSTRGR